MTILCSECGDVADGDHTTQLCAKCEDYLWGGETRQEWREWMDRMRDLARLE